MIFFKYFKKISTGNPSPSHLVQHLGHDLFCALQPCICWSQHPRPCPFPWWFCRKWVLFSGIVNFASLFGWSKGSSQPPGSNGAFWNLQQLAQFPFLPWSCSELPCWQAAACEMHISKQMAPGAHNCCQTCVDFNSPFSLALCEITCLCVVTQLNCQLWWLSLAFTTISGNHQYYLRGWTEEEKIIPEVQVNILVSVNEAAFFSGLKETWAELSFPIFIVGRLSPP